MVFKKKKAELGDQFAVFQKRETPRFVAGGGISIEGFEGEGLLKNICVSGCCLESVTYVAIVPSQVYQIRIDPRPGINMEPFTARFKASWTRSSESAFEAGFSLETGRQDQRLQRYVEQLRIQGVRPEYGNQGHGQRSDTTD